MNERLVITILCLGLWAFPASVHARCMDVNIKDAFSKADAVVEADVIASKPYLTSGWSEVHLNVKKEWKKSKLATKTILDFSDSPARPPLVVGETYLIFLERPLDGRLTVGKCSPQTRKLPVSKDDILKLQQLTRPR